MGRKPKLGLNKNQQKALDLILERGDEGTLVKDVAKAIKDDTRIARHACEYLWKEGLVIKKRTWGVITTARRFNNIRTQKMVAYFPLEQD
jgi:hypothetical protein